MAADTCETCTVGALARLAGVSPDTIRHYERLGVLPRAARSPAGYRVWSRHEVEYLKWIGPAKRAGFSLRELAEVFRMYRSGVAPCDVVRDLLQQKVRELDAEIAELIGFRRELGRVLGVWDDRLQQSAAEEFVHLLDDLHDLRQERPRRRLTRSRVGREQRGAALRELTAALPRRPCHGALPAKSTDRAARAPRIPDTVPGGTP
jgi:DNA-binding transcriptional MerR regulator